MRLLSGFGSVIRKGVGVLMVLTAFSAPAMALDVVPEIDPGAMVSGLALFIGGTMMLSDRIWRKKK